MTEFKEEKIEVSHVEQYDKLNRDLNKTIQEFNAAPPGDTPDRGPGAGEQGAMWPTHLDPAMQQGYVSELKDDRMVPGKESPGGADKTKNREPRDPQS